MESDMPAITVLEFDQECMIDDFGMFHQYTIEYEANFGEDLLIDFRSLIKTSYKYIFNETLNDIDVYSMQTFEKFVNVLSDDYDFDISEIYPDVKNTFTMTVTNLQNRVKIKTTCHHFTDGIVSIINFITSGAIS